MLLVLGVAAAQAIPGLISRDLIGQVEDRYNSARTLSVEFSEHYSLLGHPRPPESGLLQLRKTGKMRWEYAQPAGKLFVSDGKNLFLYTAWDNRVEKVPLRQADNLRAPLAFLLGKLDVRKEFSNIHLQTGSDGTKLTADSSNGSTPYKGIQMLLSAAGVITQLKILGRDESELNFEFANEQRNVPLPEALFHFVPPPGAQVTDAIASEDGTVQ